MDIFLLNKNIVFKKSQDFVGRFGRLEKKESKKWTENAHIDTIVSFYTWILDLNKRVHFKFQSKKYKCGF